MPSGWTPLEEDGGERRQGERERIAAAHPGVLTGVHAAEVADVRAAIDEGIGVEDFFVVAGARDADAIAVTDDGSGVEDDDDHVVRVFAAADEANHSVVGVVGIEPFETLPIKIHLMESRLRSDELIEVLDEALDAAMRIVFQEMPIETAGLAPFMALAKFLPHEE